MRRAEPPAASDQRPASQISRWAMDVHEALDNAAAHINRAKTKLKDHRRKNQLEQIKLELRMMSAFVKKHSTLRSCGGEGTFLLLKAFAFDVVRYCTELRVREAESKTRALFRLPPQQVDGFPFLSSRAKELQRLLMDLYRLTQNHFGTPGTMSSSCRSPGNTSTPPFTAEFGPMGIYRHIDSTLVKIMTAVPLTSDSSEPDDLKAVLRGIADRMSLLRAVTVSLEAISLNDIWIPQLQDLVWDIEDFIDLLEYKPKGSRLMRWSMMLTETRVLMISGFMRRIEQLEEWAEHSRCSGTEMLANGNTGIAIPQTNELGQIEVVPEVMAGRMRDLAELLVEGGLEHLRVVSIVGRCGLGKTTVARMMYAGRDTLLGRRFDCFAWVHAGRPSGSGLEKCRDLLQEILKQVGYYDGGSDIGATDAERLRTYLLEKRYFIVIDDLRNAEVWADIKFAFPEYGKSSVILVTTRVISVAMACSSGGYVYRLNGLNEEESAKLLQSVSGIWDINHELESICRKCDGLPLALVCGAKFARNSDSWEAAKFAREQLVTGLRPQFQPVRNALMEWFQELGCRYDLKACILSMSMFHFNKKDGFKRNSLIRRWIAEGLVAEHNVDAALECFRSFIDGSLVEPIETLDLKPAGKRCRVHSIMLEFLLYRSITEKFGSLIRGGDLLTNDGRISPRRLCTDSTTSKHYGEYLENCRSLTIVGNMPVYLLKCKLLRVLDLENCRRIDDDVLGCICGLLFLKYLSLRGSDARRLPQEMGKLRQLETLDVRETVTMKLPPEVIALPHLVYLFGAFDLAVNISSSNRVRRQIGYQMHTLAGIVLSETSIPALKYVLDNMKKLKKVKIWWESIEAPSVELAALLVDTLQRRFSIGSDLESLSLNFGGQSIDFLQELQAANTSLHSIKLNGRLCKLPRFLAEHALQNLTELHLSSTGLSCEDLWNLQVLPCLQYLKLVEESDGFRRGRFQVISGGFPALLGLRIQSYKLPEVVVTDGGMPYLTRLQLLCDDVSGFRAANMEHLQHLDQVVLKKSSVDEGSMFEWMAAVKKHKNRPRIEFV